MNKSLFIFLLLNALFSLPGFASGPDAVTPESVRMLLVEYPDSALLLLNKCSAEKSLPTYQIALLRSLAYNEKRMFSLAERYAREALADDSINNHEKEKLNALTMLADAQRFYGNFQGSIQTSSQAMEMARKAGNAAAEFNILTTMAKTSFAMGRRQQGYDYLDQIISSGENSDDARTLANVSAAYGVKIVELYADDRFEEGLKEGRKRLALIEKIDRAGGAPDGFTDQQRAYAYARIASCAERAGEKGEAKKSFEAFMATDYARRPMGRAYAMDYLLDSGNWRMVLDFTAPLYPILSQGDTINGDYQSLLVSDARAYAGLGDFRKAYGLSLRAQAVSDSLTQRENTLKAEELATVFALNEKELALGEAKASLERKHLLLVFALVGIALVLIILGLLFRAYRIKIKEQKFAAQRIDELLGKELSAEITPETDEDFRVFTELQQKIIQEKLFRQSTFNREAMMQVSGLSRSRVVNLIEKYTGLTPTEYVNKLRVEYSAKLIQEHPEWTIDAIAEECGYSRRGTYYTHFNKFFGITPAQYRREKLR